MKKITILLSLMFFFLNSFGQASPIHLDYTYIETTIKGQLSSSYKTGYITFTDEGIVVYDKANLSYDTLTIINHEKRYNNGRPFLVVGANDFEGNNILVFVFYGKEGNINMISFKDDNGDQVIYSNVNFRKL